MRIMCGNGADQEDLFLQGGSWIGSRKVASGKPQERALDVPIDGSGTVGVVT